MITDKSYLFRLALLVVDMQNTRNKGKAFSRCTATNIAIIAWVLFFSIYLLGLTFFFKKRNDTPELVVLSNETRGSFNGKKIVYPALMKAPDETYPKFKNLLDVVTDWNPDNVEIPDIFVETLQHFDYSDPVERSYAEKFRDAEVPFKVYNVPNVDEVRRKWSEPYLKNVMKKSLRIETSKDNHFMYFKEGRHHPEGWDPPQKLGTMGFSDWYRAAQEADMKKLKHTESHIYLTVGTSSRHEDAFFARDLPMFNTGENNFFITDIHNNKGIQCRFGMRGVIAEAHYDSGRNMVAMFRGAKRYILNPPSACPYLSIISDTHHPSYRHSNADWSNIEQARDLHFDKAEAIDTIVREGEVLYIPSFWFHYIVSLQYSIQCNSRSGFPPSMIGQDAIQKCYREFPNKG